MKFAFPIRYLISGLSFLYWISGYHTGNALWAQQEYPQSISRSDSALVASLIKQSAAVQFQYPDSAMTLVNKALAIGRRQHHNRSIARALTLKAALFHNEKKYPAFKSCIFEALSYSDGSPDFLPTIYSGIGSYYTEESAFDSASYYFTRALQTIDTQKKKDTALMAAIYVNLGSNFSNMGQHDLALYYMRQSIVLSRQKKDTVNLAFGYYDIGNAFYNAGSMDSAIKYLNEAIPLYRSRKQPSQIQLLYSLLAYAWMDKKNFGKTRLYFDSAIAVDKASAGDIYTIYQGKGLLCLKEARYDMAITYLEQALKICERQSLRQPKLNIYKLLADAQEKRNDYKEAHSNLERYLELQDSLMNEKMIKTVNQLEVKYRTTEKDKELVKNKLQLALTEAKLSKSNTRTIGMISGIVVLLISMIIIFLKQRLQLQKAKVAEQLQRVEQLKAVIEGEERERSRIGRQLHDDIMVELSIVKMGLNTLPFKYPDIKYTENYNTLVRQLNHTSQKLRQSAHNLMPDALLTEGLIPAITYFCGNITEMTGLRIHFQHYGDIPRLPADMEISIYRIIQELVQNTIKHAHAANTLVQLNYREHILSITVEDDGVGFDLKQSEGANKMGLKSIQTRLKTMNGIIDIHECKPHGTSVNISLAIQ